MEDKRISDIPGQPPSAEIRAKLKAENRPVLVAYSRGKDAMATNLALKEADIETILVYMYGEPGLQFIEDDIKRQEDWLQQKIHQYPHPSFYRQLNSLIFQPPERCQVIEAAALPEIDYTTLWQIVREDLNLALDTWVADGVRAADSPLRRLSFMRHGAMKTNNRKVSPIYDWRKQALTECLDRHGAVLPKEYDWFGRSYDGIDYRFLAPLKEHAPEDYKRVLDWFPLADLEIFRHDKIGATQTTFNHFSR